MKSHPIVAVGHGVARQIHFAAAVDADPVANVLCYQVVRNFNVLVTCSYVQSAVSFTRTPTLPQRETGDYDAVCARGDYYRF